MIIRGFFEFGTPYVVVQIKCINLEIIATIRFLVDTGASRTVISDKDAVKLGIDYNKLKKLEDGMIGIGGQVETFLMDNVELLFKSDGGIHVEKLDILVLKHREMDEKIKKIPSLLGRDIMNRYALSLNAKRNLVEIIIREQS
jgi:predicted aspartyl protease